MKFHCCGSSYHLEQSSYHLEQKCYMYSVCTLLRKSRKMANICSDHHLSVCTLDSDDALIEKHSNYSLWDIVSFLDKHLRQSGRIYWWWYLAWHATDYRIRDMLSLNGRYYQPWLAIPLRLCYLLAEIV